jgi:hypothetical protein
MCGAATLVRPTRLRAVSSAFVVTFPITRIEIST